MGQIILKNKLIECEWCNRILRLQEEVAIEELPVTVMCSECKHHAEWAIMPMLPKIAPDTKLPHGQTTFGTLLLVPNAKAIDSEVAAAAEAAPEQAAPVSFLTRAASIEGLLANLFHETGSLHKEVEQFETAMRLYFMDQYRLCNEFTKHWNHNHLGEFLANPFMSLPVGGADPEAALYNRLIISPRFYTFPFGIEHPTVGGLRVYSVNQYTRMTYDIPDVMCSYLQVPKSLQLCVTGNKLLGSDLDDLIDSIPGLRKDIDSTPSNPSVFIYSSRLTRTWLAQHGVKPWSDSSVTIPSSNMATAMQALKAYHCHDLDQKFLRWGRLGLPWIDGVAAKEVALILASLVQQQTMIICTVEKKEVWRDLEFALQRRGLLGDKRFSVYIVNKDNQIDETLLGTMRSVIVDLSGEAGYLALHFENLFRYCGHLLAVTDSQFLDAEDGNVVAKNFYGLVGRVFYQPVNRPKLPVDKSDCPRLPVDHPVLAALRRLKV